MTTYQFPAEPAGPVWDREGRKWAREFVLWTTLSGPGYKYSSWLGLLYEQGPLTDEEPIT
ncbi:hypothetical protein EJ997_10145 [Flaviflexus ciconiae]|uniref:Uncharacterized protein n=1 Tax=Flaviflexus ciconiae TaxID=2496867 RepID=A0A3Q9G8H9_9ACTO|nr:hypothetical protein [Flaviflexus ciconiae]AZQ77643.1 hypothetical protein EJ997_10145 [Flaviflexus ciconiae]